MALDTRTCQYWFKKFKNANVNLLDEEENLENLFYFKVTLILQKKKEE